MNKLPTFSTHSTKEVLDHYWEMHDKLKEAHKKGSTQYIFTEEEEYWYMEMTKFLVWGREANSG